MTSIDRTSHNAPKLGAIRSRPVMPEYDWRWVMKRYGVSKAEALKMVQENVRRARIAAGWDK